MCIFAPDKQSHLKLIFVLLLNFSTETSITDSCVQTMTRKKKLCIYTLSVRSNKTISGKISRHSMCKYHTSLLGYTTIYDSLSAMIIPEYYTRSIKVTPTDNMLSV